MNQRKQISIHAAYMESLGAWEIFCAIDVPFMPTGPTHKDIYQAFRRTSEQLCRNNAISLSNLHMQLM